MGGCTSKKQSNNNFHPVIILLESIISASSAVQPFEPLEVEQTPPPPIKQK